jgi:2-desacetyl-2-hydroxyethyl bacteriochlorophyllide A dehydrogenase
MRSVVWPSVGTIDVVHQDEPPAGADDVVVDVSVSVISPGTERARLLGLPTADVQFPHIPGYLAAGFVRSARETPPGTRVAVRGAGHRSVAVAPARLVRAVCDHVALADAAVWQLALTALHGLARGDHQPGEPAAVVGGGLLGVITRRLLAALGAPTVTGVASSYAKAWAARTEPATTFLSVDRVSADWPLVLDVTGSPDGLAAAIAATADTGRIVLLGSPRAALADVPLQQVYDRQLRIIGAHIASLDDGDEPALSQAYFDLLTSGRFTVGDVLVEYPGHEAPAVYQRLVTDRSFVGAALRWTSDRQLSGGNAQ